MSLTATVLIPTTTDRGPLLPFCVGSVLRQTVPDLEVFIIGDGVNDQTRDTIHDLMRQDARIRFFDYPKHPRRGEVYRHEALQEARGRLVAYLCDRDLWLPNHLQTLDRLLETGNLAATNFYQVRRDQRLFIPYRPTKADVAVQAILSAVGHTLDFYRSLPYGWRTTPAGIPTDRYMWQQMLAQPDCRPVAGWLPTLLYFKRGGHPGWSTQQRYEELKPWSARLEQPDGIDAVVDQALMHLIQDRNHMRLSWLALRGRSLSELPGWFSWKVQRWLNPPADDAAEESYWPDLKESGR
ncbi:glycosyltransferase family A protein [Fibrisoma limi]|uniref:glycosyltransferase family A protein n=1 Tax=Fibrisoma limi TaxID=663275 RepID=UPI0003084514|nr:glycosyltransferase family A protein [Fibrisoma limi]